MKKILAAFVTSFILTGGAARADVLTLSTPDLRNEFVARYTLDSFQIAPNSVRLEGMGQVVSGTVEINEATRQLRLTLNRHLVCPRGVMCIAMVPAPTVITLPIRVVETDVCGGLHIVAERNLQLVDGGLTRVEIEDHNGGTQCDANVGDEALVKRVKVIVDENGPRPHAEATSLMTGFPTQR